jgi:hypothetical protein
MKTLSCVIERLTRQGFTAHFGVVGNRLRAFESGKTFGAQEMIIREYERFEGVSDPDDMAIVYAIEILNGTRGWLVDAFGVYSNPAVSAFMQDVPIRRTVPDSSSGPSVSDRPPSGANGQPIGAAPRTRTGVAGASLRIFRPGSTSLRTPSSGLSGCWCRANRLLSGSERLADVLLGILQEAFGATQRMPAAVQNLPSLLIDRPHPVRRPSAHAARPFSHIALDFSSPEPCDDSARDHSKNESLSGSHVRSSPTDASST